MSIFKRKKSEPFYTSAEALCDLLDAGKKAPKNIVLTDEEVLLVSKKKFPEDKNLSFRKGTVIQAPYATSVVVKDTIGEKSFDFPEAKNIKMERVSAQTITADKANHVAIFVADNLQEASFNEAVDVSLYQSPIQKLNVPQADTFELLYCTNLTDLHLKQGGYARYRENRETEKNELELFERIESNIQKHKAASSWINKGMRIMHTYGLPVATVGISTAYAMSEHPQSFPATFSGVASAVTLGIVNEAVRDVGFFGGALAGGLLSRRDDNVKNAKTVNELASAKSTMRGYAYAGAYIIGSAVLYAAAPKTLEFAKDKIVPLFADNSQTVQQVGQEYLARMEERNDTGLWHSYAAREGFQPKPAVS